MKKSYLPPAILLGGLVIAIMIVVTGPGVGQQAPPSKAPLVRIWKATPETVQLKTITHGTVLPRTESDLIPEVSGRVLSISQAMVSGGFFKKGDLLFEIEALDYEVALEQARAALASAMSELATTKKSHARLAQLAKQQSVSESLLDDALNRFQFAEASFKEATARLSKAKRDLTRTKVTAPYDGRVRAENVDIGQFVNRGAPLAKLYAIDYAEVRLPIHDEELAYLELSLSAEEMTNHPRVILRARFGGKEHSWEGKIVRTEGELDPQTRMLNVIAQVEAPYQLGDKGRPPLAVGLFVEAEILGKEVDNIYILPRTAMQTEAQVYVIDANNQLQFRTVEVLRTIDGQVYISSGFATGELICLSTVSNAIQGMTVRPLNDAAESQATARRNQL